MILTGKTEDLEKTCPSATLSTTNPMQTDLGTNLGLHSERPATNHLRNGTAFNCEVTKHATLVYEATGLFIVQPISPVSL
jgi:hypothetical protein